jgi:uncharacterized delta-60 repeat protein
MTSQVALVAEPGPGGDLGQRQFLVLEQAPGALDATLERVVNPSKGSSDCPRWGASAGARNVRYRQAGVRPQIGPYDSRPALVLTLRPEENAADRSKMEPSMKTRTTRRLRAALEALESRALLTAGTLDTTFGGTGTVLGSRGVDTAVLVQPADGKIVTAGYSPDASGHNEFTLARYNPDGTADNGFGVGGRVVTSVAGDGSQIHSAVLQSDGKIVAVGEAFIPPSNKFGTAKDEIAVVRYTAGGALDTTFGGTRNKNGTVSNAGEVFLSFGSGKDVATAVALETVNNTTKIVVAGWTNSVTGHPEIVLARFNSDGSPDTTFGTHGTVVTAIPNSSIAPSAYAVAVQSDGRIVVAGGTNGPGPYPAFLARYNVSGSLDSTFGTNGLVLAQLTSQDVFNGVAIQSDGKIVVAGSGTLSGNTDGEVARYNANGTLDTTFAGGSGVFLGPASGSQYFAVALQSNGQIIAAGAAPNSESLVTRLNAAGSLDSTYGSGGSVIAALGQVSQYNAVAIQPADGEAVTAGYTSASWPAQNHMVARYTP